LTRNGMRQPARDGRKDIIYPVTRFLGIAFLLAGLCSLSMAEDQSGLLPKSLRPWKLAFVRDSNIWVSNDDGTDQKLILENGQSPAWSPDKSRIAFVRDNNIWVAEADGGKPQPVTKLWKKGDSKNESRYPDVSISWHPKNGSLTFSHPEAFKVERLDGMAGIIPTQKAARGIIVGSSIFDVPLNAAEPGRAIARYDFFEGGTSFFFADHAHPAWSPSGRKLAFTRNGDIWIAAAKGGLDREPPSDWETRRVAAVAEFDEPVRRGSRYNQGATRLSWHPDGRRLVYAYDRLQGSGFNEIHLLDTLSGKDSVVVRDGLEPCVSPDGRFILYTAYGDACGPDGSCICAVSLDGKNRLKLLPGGSQPVW